MLEFSSGRGYRRGMSSRIGGDGGEDAEGR